MTGPVKQKAILFGLLLFLAFLPLLNGCNAPKNNLAVFNRHLESGNWLACADFAVEKVDLERPKPGNHDLLWALQLAAVQRVMKNYELSNEYFDKSEDMLKYFDHQTKVFDHFSATAINDNAIPYRGETYDGIMVNTYKALNFMASGDTELARVEFNRALDRQRRAKENFIEEINQLKSQLDEKGQNSNDFTKASVENPKIDELIAQKYPNLQNFEVYPDFVNPFSTYLAAVFFKLQGQRAKAADLFKESLGMVPDNSYLAKDLEMIENSFQQPGEDESTVWVIFENGLGPVKEEFRLDIPLFVATDKVKYFGIALPELKFRPAAYPYLTIHADANSCRTELLADMDRVVQTEFKKRFPVILTRTIISATAKATAQYVFERQNSSNASLASALMAAYSFATTAADVRIWTALPKNFQIARLEMPENRTLKIFAGQSLALDIDIGKCDNAIIYVKITTDLNQPIYEIICF